MFARYACNTGRFVEHNLNNKYKDSLQGASCFSPLTFLADFTVYYFGFVINDFVD
jgi:hypothetical protein